jgi:hypothetical protein
VHPRALPSRSSSHAPPRSISRAGRAAHIVSCCMQQQCRCPAGLGATIRGWPLVQRVRSVRARSTQPVRERGGLATSLPCAGALQGRFLSFYCRFLGRSHRDRAVKLGCPRLRVVSGRGRSVDALTTRPCPEPIRWARTTLPDLTTIKATLLNPTKWLHMGCGKSATCQNHAIIAWVQLGTPICIHTDPYGRVAGWWVARDVANDYYIV